jgi:hypothetical protein
MKPIVFTQPRLRPLVGPTYGTNDRIDKALVMRGKDC